MDAKYLSRNLMFHARTKYIEVGYATFYERNGYKEAC
jgi:hypothetical protein